MGVFADLLEQLDRDVETVHGARFPITWVRDPNAKPEARWSARIEGPRKPFAEALGPSGEDPLRRLAERYAEKARRKLGK